MNAFICLIALVFSLSFRIPCYADMVASSSDAAEPATDISLYDEPESPELGTPMEIYTVNAAYSVRAITSSDLVNCVRYDVNISGDSYILLLPSDFESNVMVDSDGYLWNMSASQIQGRLFTDSFDPTEDTGKLLYLGPCLGNNFSNNANYGSPNYVRNYYWSSDRLTYSTEYVVVEVVDAYWMPQTGDILKYVMIFLVGCCLVCLWKRSAS